MAVAAAVDVAGVEPKAVAESEEAGEEESSTCYLQPGKQTQVVAAAVVVY